MLGEAGLAAHDARPRPRQTEARRRHPAGGHPGGRTGEPAPWPTPRSRDRARPRQDAAGTRCQDGARAARHWRHNPRWAEHRRITGWPSGPGRCSVTGAPGSSCCAGRSGPSPTPQRHASRPDARVEEQPARSGFHLTTAVSTSCCCSMRRWTSPAGVTLPRDPACAEVRRQICNLRRRVEQRLPHYPVPSARTPATSLLLTAAATREAIEPAGFCALAWQDDTEAAKAWIAQLRASGPLPSPNLGVMMGAGLCVAFRQPRTKSHSSRERA